MLSNPWPKARALLTVHYAFMMEYRAELVLWAIATSLPLIMMGVWIPAGSSGRFGLDAVGFARYFLAAYIVHQMSIVWVIYDFDWYIVSGRLSPYLLQPLDPAWRFLAAHVSEQGARLPFVALIVGGFFVLYPQALWGAGGEDLWVPAPQRVLIAVVATYCAFALRFLMQYSLAMAAFWVERAASLERLLYLPYLFLSGLLAPLEVYQGTPLKDALREIAMFTPFPYLLWFPARLLAGGEVPVGKAFAVMGAWGIALWGLNRWLWRKGLGRYSAMGA